jgi:hypothetical protein
MQLLAVGAVLTATQPVPDGLPGQVAALTVKHWTDTRRASVDARNKLLQRIFAVIIPPIL